MLAVDKKTKLISLTQDKFAIVDETDFEQLNGFRWYVKIHKNTCYACRQIQISKNHQYTVRMHHQIMGKPPKGFEIDHKNGNGLDNRRCNLRLCTRKENAINGRSHKDSKSKYKGVSWYRRGAKWHAQICPSGKKIHLGYFDSEIEAAKAYDQAARKYFGAFANPNFKEAICKSNSSGNIRNIKTFLN